MKVFILYYTKTQHTLEAANAVAEGIRSEGSEKVELIAADNFEPAQLNNYDALIVCSPCHAGSISFSDGIAKSIKKALAKLEPEALKGKKCAAISVHAGAGGKKTIQSIEELLKQKGCDDYMAGPVAQAGVPLSLWKGPSVKSEDRERFKKFGVQFVKNYNS